MTASFSQHHIIKSSHPQTKPHTPPQTTARADFYISTSLNDRTSTSSVTVGVLRSRNINNANISNGSNNDKVTFASATFTL